MARRSNYSFERYQRDLAKAEKKAARREARSRRKERSADEGQLEENGAQAGDGTDEETSAPE